MLCATADWPPLRRDGGERSLPASWQRGSAAAVELMFLGNVLPSNSQIVLQPASARVTMGLTPNDTINAPPTKLLITDDKELIKRMNDHFMLVPQEPKRGEIHNTEGREPSTERREPSTEIPVIYN